MRKKIKAQWKKVPAGMIVNLTQDFMYPRVRVKGFWKHYLRKQERRNFKRKDKINEF